MDWPMKPMAIRPGQMFITIRVRGWGSAATPLFGPMRCGWTVGGSREASGDTFYGISDMSGNLRRNGCAGWNGPRSRFYRDVMVTECYLQRGERTNADWPGFNATDGEVKDSIFVRFKGGSCFGNGTVDNFYQVSRCRAEVEIFNASEKS